MLKGGGVWNQAATFSVNVPILLDKYKLSQSRASLRYDIFSVRSDQSSGLSLSSVTEYLHSPIELVLVGLDIQKEHRVLFSSVFFMVGSGSEPNGGSLGAYFRGVWVFSLPLEAQIFILQNVSDTWIKLFLCLQCLSAAP